MYVPIDNVVPFYAWRTQLWSAAGRLQAAHRAAQVLRAQHDASQLLRARIAQYEHQQPSYAADLSAALARQEAERSRD